MSIEYKGKADSTITWGLASTPINNMIGEKKILS